MRARQAIIATNSYSDLTSATARLQRTLVPFRSAIIATEKLSPNLAGSLMPTGRTYTETKRMMRWFRKVDDRVIFGGRGAFGKQDSESAFDALRRAMIGIFPELADVPLAFRWSGLVGMTLDSVPHVGRLDDRTLYSVGYNGAGVAMSSLMGRYLASLVRGRDSRSRPARCAPRSGPFHSIRCVNRPSAWWPAGTNFWMRSGVRRSAPDHNKRG